MTLQPTDSVCGWQGRGMSRGKRRPLDIFIFLLWAFWTSFPRQSCAVKEGQRWELPSPALSQGPLCTQGPRGQALDAPSVAVVKSALYVEGEVVGFVLFVCSHIANEAVTIISSLHQIFHLSILKRQLKWSISFCGWQSSRLWCWETGTSTKRELSCERTQVKAYFTHLNKVLPKKTLSV